MEQKWSIRLIRFAAIFGLIGTFIGSHMSGNMGIIHYAQFMRTYYSLVGYPFLHGEFSIRYTVLNIKN